MAKLIHTTLLMLIGIVTLHAETIENRAGKLADNLPDNALQITQLTITGEMDARDFSIMADSFPALIQLDLSAVEIKAWDSYTPMLGSETLFAANQLPAHSFFGMTTLAAIKLPATLQSIGKGALTATDIAEIVLPQNTTTIGDYAFYDCKKLSRIVVSESLTKIGNYTFAGCISLKTADLSNSKLTTIGNSAFIRTPALEQVVLPPTLTEIGGYSFATTTNLKNITLPTSIKKIGEGAFMQSSISSITLSKSVKTIGEFAFAHCHNLTTATLESENAEIGEGIFFDCPNLQRADIKSSAEITAYQYTGTRSLQLDNAALLTANRIGAYSLKDNGSTQLTLGSSLTTIDNGAMEQMDRLEQIDVTALDRQVPTLGNEVFAGIEQSNVTLLTTTSEPWLATEGWREFRMIETGIENATIDNGVKAWLDGNDTLIVESTTPIERIRVHTPDGLKAIDRQIGECRAETALNAIESRICIITITTTDGQCHRYKLARQ